MNFRSFLIQCLVTCMLRAKREPQSVNCKSIIHLIDDDQAMLDALSLLLKIEGYTIRTYNSAQSFFDINKEHECGCVLTDMHMPEISRTRSVSRNERTRCFFTHYRDHSSWKYSARERRNGTGSVRFLRKALRRRCSTFFRSRKHSFCMGTKAVEVHSAKSLQGL